MVEEIVGQYEKRQKSLQEKVQEREVKEFHPPQPRRDIDYKDAPITSANTREKGKANTGGNKAAQPAPVGKPHKSGKHKGDSSLTGLEKWKRKKRLTQKLRTNEKEKGRREKRVLSKKK